MVMFSKTNSTTFVAKCKYSPIHKLRKVYGTLGVVRIRIF